MVLAIQMGEKKDRKKDTHTKKSITKINSEAYLSMRLATLPHGHEQAGEQGLRAAAGQAGPSPSPHTHAVPISPPTESPGPCRAVGTGTGRGQAGMSGQPGGPGSARPGTMGQGLSRKVVPEVGEAHKETSRSC